MIAVLTLSTFVMSCHKRNAAEPNRLDNSMTKQAVAFNYGVSTAGEVHHLLFNEYFRRYPADTLGIDTITIAVVDSFCRRMAQIAVDSGIIPNLNPDSFMVQTVNYEISEGYFNNNGYRDMTNIIAAQTANITNSSIRNVVTNINSYTGPHSGFLNYVDAQLNILANVNLSTWDRLLVDIYGSITHDSYNTMDLKYEVSQKEKVRLIAKADAVAAGKALKRCVLNGSILLGSVYVEYYCATQAAIASAEMYAYLKRF